MLDHGAANNFSGAEPAAVLDQAYDKRGRKARDDRNVEAVEEKYHVRGIREQVIKFFIKLQMPGALGGKECTPRRF